MDMGNELLAEAGLRVTRPETLAQGQREMFNDHQVILNILETSRGVLSTLARETLSAVGIEIISRQPRRVLNPNGESGVVQGLANTSPNRTDLPDITSHGTKKLSSKNAVAIHQPSRANTPQRKRFILASDANGSGIMDWVPFAQEDVVDDRGSPMQVVTELEVGWDDRTMGIRNAECLAQVTTSGPGVEGEAGPSRPKSQLSRSIKPLPGSLNQRLSQSHRLRNPGGDASGSRAKLKHPVPKNKVDPSEESEDEEAELFRTSTIMGVGPGLQQFPTSREQEPVPLGSLPRPSTSSDPEIGPPNTFGGDAQSASRITNTISSTVVALPQELAQAANPYGGPGNELFTSVTQSLYDMSLMQKDRMDMPLASLQLGLKLVEIDRERESGGFIATKS
ncbi:hypothetical protein FRC05_003820 [Tulasnella sp. 425]|nr:hypothetical protein FRC05_003820 [Tulasnella sp. 425]